MNRRKIIGMAAAGAAGLAAAVALALPSIASAYTIDQLPNMGYAVNELDLGNNCHDWKVSGYGASTDLGSDCDPGYQAALDAFVNATYPPLQPTTTATTTTAPVTTTDTTVTDTTATTTAAAPTQTAPATTTPTSPAPAAPVTTTPTCDLQCEIDGLQAQIDALRSELTKLEQILQTWPNLDPAILAQLMALGS